jgi:polar amino acid transport system permease protein
VHRFLHAFVDPFAFRQALPDVWSGFLINVHMMLIAEALVLVLALLIAIVRGLPGRGAKPLRGLAIAYTDFFRGTPLTIVAYVCILGLPGLGYPFLKNASSEALGVVALTIVYTAYVTEVYRAGIESVHGSQRMAARSLGLTYMQALRYVVLPQAIRRVVPPLLNDFIGLQKDTAIIGAIGVTEAAAQATNYANSYFNYTGYFVAAVFFVYLTIPLARFTDNLIRQRELRERAAGI